MFLIILKTCSLFTSWIYQVKIKCKDGSSYFYKYQKYRSLEIEKKIPVISFQKFLMFYICVFPEYAQCFVGVCL